MLFTPNLTTAKSRRFLFLPCAGFLLAAMLAGGSARSAPASAQSDLARKQVESLFAGFDQAYRKRDVKAIQALMNRDMTSDFTRKLPDGPTMNRKQLIANAGSDLNQLASIAEATTTLDKFTLTGNTATALAHTRLVGTLTDVHKIALKIDNRSNAFYGLVKTASGWKIHRMVGIDQELRVNDKLIRPTSAKTPQK